MVQHMVLSMVVPLALALGAPVTLALRTLPAGPRRWLLAVLHSRVGQGAVVPAADLRALRRSRRGRSTSPGGTTRSLSSTYVHEMMHVHLVLVGSLFFWPLMGVDPVPGRVSYPFRMLLVVLTLPFHAFLGVTIMDSTTADRRRATTPPCARARWAPGCPTPLDDQHLAGGILWGSGDLVGPACSSRCCSPSGCVPR